jgi:hypothetical protein
MELPSPLDLPDVWDSVGLFLHQLQSAPTVDHQLRATLELIRSATAADRVLLYHAVTHEVRDCSPAVSLDPKTDAALCGSLLAEVAPEEAELVRPPGSGSAALLRLSRSRGAWVIALRTAGPAFTSRELKLMTLARRLLHQEQQQQQVHDQLKEMLFGVVRCLTGSLDARDPYTWGHSDRVARIAVRLAEQMGLHESVRSELYLGGLLHDIGKIGVPDHILRKPGRLSEEEFELVKQHPVIGDALLVHVRQLAHLRPIVRNHHERYDGQGYPDGLAGERIPFGARIVAVADSCDAMMSARPYRKALPTEQIESIFRDGAGRQWAPDVVEAFLACRRDAFSICERGLGDSVVRAVEDALRTAGVPSLKVRHRLGE